MEKPRHDLVAEAFHYYMHYFLLRLGLSNQRAHGSMQKVKGEMILADGNEAVAKWRRRVY